MEAVRYISAPLHVEFSSDVDNEDFKREYDAMASSDDDSVGEWLRIAKARGETSESDQVLLTLVVELHRKIDELNAILKGEKPVWVDLDNKAEINGVSFEHFRLLDGKFEVGKKYYGRIAMPIFPKRNVGMYFQAISSNEAKIELMHERDEKDWSAYVVARERVMIREMRAKKDGN